MPTVCWLAGAGDIHNDLLALPPDVRIAHDAMGAGVRGHREHPGGLTFQGVIGPRARARRSRCWHRESLRLGGKGRHSPACWASAWLRGGGAGRWAVGPRELGRHGVLLDVGGDRAWPSRARSAPGAEGAWRRSGRPPSVSATWSSPLARSSRWLAHGPLPQCRLSPGRADDHSENRPDDDLANENESQRVEPGPPPANRGPLPRTHAAEDRSRPHQERDPRIAG